MAALVRYFPLNRKAREEVKHCNGMRFCYVVYFRQISYYGLCVLLRSLKYELQRQFIKIKSVGMRILRRNTLISSHVNVQKKTQLGGKKGVLNRSGCHPEWQAELLYQYLRHVMTDR